MPKMLLEDSWSFRPDLKRSQIVESKPTSAVAGATALSRARRIPGIMAECDVVGGNGRRYRKAVWEKNLAEGSILRNKISEGSAWGQLEHPKDGIVDLTSPIAFQLVDIKLNESGQLEGVIEIYEDLPEGRKLSVLIDRGYIPKVSSRGMGSLVKASDGIDDVDLDYVCEGWDAVANPSFVKAVLRPELASIENKEFPAVGRVSESATESPKAATTNTVVATKKEPLMNMTQVRESIPTLRSFNPSNATPAQLSEGFARITECHRALAVESADATKSWDCSRLHEELDKIEEAWTKEITAPKVEVARLTESNKRLVAVTEAAVKTVKQYRGQLTETVKTNKRMRSMLESLVGKVRGWDKVCKSRDGKITKLSEGLDVTTEALDILVSKYKNSVAKNSKLAEDNETLKEALAQLTEEYHKATTSLGSKLIVAKYPEESKDAKVNESLKAAKSLKDLNVIKESIKTARKSNTAGKLEESKTTEQKVEKVTKSEDVQKSEAAGRSVVKFESVQAINMEPTDPSSLSESIALVRRQGKSQKVAA